MEVKINKEIRNYTESVFFGLTLRQFVFSVLAVGIACRNIFYFKTVFCNIRIIMDVYFRGNTICSTWICYI